MFQELLHLLKIIKSNIKAVTQQLIYYLKKGILYEKIAHRKKEKVIISITLKVVKVAEHFNFTICEITIQYLSKLISKFKLDILKL